jgi:hypothetical protein
MAQALGVAHHRDLRVGLDVVHEGLAAAGDDQVDQVVLAEQLLELLALLEQGDARGVQAVRREHPVEHGHQRAVAVQGLAAALEQRRVAALEREAADLRDRVGSRLEDDAEHAERAGHALEHEALVELAAQVGVAEQLRGVGELGEAVGDAAELVGVEAETLVAGRVDLAALEGGVGEREVLGVGGDQRGDDRGVAQGAGEVVQEGAAGAARQCGEAAAGLAGGPGLVTDLGHGIKPPRARGCHG